MVDQAIKAAGGIVGGAAGYETGKYNRAVAQTQAVDEERAGTAAEARIRDGAAQQIGQQVAAQGANGFQQGTGSAIDALTQSQINAAMDALNARQAATARARAARVQGDMAYAAGQNAMVQGLIGAGASAYGTSADWARARMGSTPQPSSSGYNGGGYNSVGATDGTMGA